MARSRSTTELFPQLKRKCDFNKTKLKISFVLLQIYKFCKFTNLLMDYSSFGDYSVSLTLRKKMSETLGFSPTFGQAVGEVKPATLSHRYACFTMFRFAHKKHFCFAKNGSLVFTETCHCMAPLRLFYYVSLTQILAMTDLVNLQIYKNQG